MGELFLQAQMYGSLYPPWDKNIKKVIATFISHNSDLLLRIASLSCTIASYKLTIQTCLHHVITHNCNGSLISAPKVEVEFF